MVLILGTQEVEVDLVVTLETISMEEDMDQEMGSVEIMVPVGVGKLMATVNMEESMDTVEPGMDMVEIMDQMET